MEAKSDNNSRNAAIEEFGREDDDGVPTNYLCWSILNVICCCSTILNLFCSMSALTYSYKVIEDIEAGQYKKAVKHSNLARKFNIFSTVCCSFGWLCVFILLFLMSTGITAVIINYINLAFDHHPANAK